jgi:adenylate cyclase
MRKAEEAAAWRKAEAALTDYDYYLRSMTYYMRYTRDDNRRSRKISEEGLARFPDSALLKIRLAWTYVVENNVFGPLENCRTTSDIAYKLGREAEEAKNKSRFLIYQNLKLMAHVYGWHGELDRSIQQAEAAVGMSPYDAELRSSMAGFIANAGKLDEAIE